MENGAHTALLGACNQCGAAPTSPRVQARSGPGSPGRLLGCCGRLRAAEAGPRVGLLAPAPSLSGFWVGSTASMGPWFSSKVPSLLCSPGSWCAAQAGSSAGANAVAGGSRSCSGACPLAPSPARPPAHTLGVVGLGSSTPEQHGSLHRPLPLRGYSPRGLLAVL